MQLTQRCPRCALDLPLDAYAERYRGKPGHYCRSCYRAYKREWVADRRVVRVCGVRDCGTRPGRVEWPYCADHQRRFERWGDPLGVRPLSTSYRAVHKRLTVQRGPASDHPCAGGCGGRGRDWAYDHSDPEPLNVEWYGHRVDYSADLDRYRPLCSSCHTRHDRVAHC